MKKPDITAATRQPLYSGWEWIILEGNRTVIPDIKDSTKEERESYIKDRFKCISDCDSCGICAMYKNQDPLLVCKVDME